MNKKRTTAAVAALIIAAYGIHWISSQIGYKNGYTDALGFVEVVLKANETHLQREIGHASEVARAIEENDKSELKRMLYQQIGEIYDRSRQSSPAMLEHVDGLIEHYITLLDGYTPPETESYEILKEAGVPGEVISATNLLVAPHYKAQHARSSEIIEMYNSNQTSEATP